MAMGTRLFSIDVSERSGERHVSIFVQERDGLVGQMEVKRRA